MKTLFLIIAIVFAHSLFAQKTKEISGFQNPESVIGYKDHLFVSNTGEKLEPIAIDGDGYISMLDRQTGNITELKYISGLNSPKGMFIKHGVLYVADVDKVQGYNIKTKKKVFEADLTKYGVTYTNDITRAFRGMFVSATLSNKIFKIKKNGKIKEVKIKKGGELTGANGLYRKHVGKLYVANYGRENQPNGGFGKIKLITHKYKPIEKGGIYDGIIKKSHKLYVTDWVSSTENKGRLVVKKPCDKATLEEMKLNRTIGGPSDIYADKSTKILYIPAMEENKIVTIPFAEIKTKKPKK